jgi:hypothetical protein
LSSRQVLGRPSKLEDRFLILEFEISPDAFFDAANSLSWPDLVQNEIAVRSCLLGEGDLR